MLKITANTFQTTSKGLSTKKISYRGVGRGQGEKEKYYLSKLDNLFSGSKALGIGNRGCTDKTHIRGFEILDFLLVHQGGLSLRR